MKASVAKSIVLSFVAALIPGLARSLEIKTPKVPTVHIEIPHAPQVTGHVLTPQLKGVTINQRRRTAPGISPAVTGPAPSGGASGSNSGGAIFNSNSAAGETGVPSPGLPPSVGRGSAHNSGTTGGAAEGGGIFNSNSATGGAGSGGGIFNSNATMGGTGVINSNTTLPLGGGPSAPGANLKWGPVITTNPDNAPGGSGPGGVSAIGAPSNSSATINLNSAGGGSSGTSPGGITVGSSPSQVELGVNSNSASGGSSGTSLGGMAVGSSPSQVELGVNSNSASGGSSGTSPGGITVGSSPSQVELGVSSNSASGGSSFEIQSFQWGVARGISKPGASNGDREGSTPSVGEIDVQNPGSTICTNCKQLQLHAPKNP